MARHVFLSSKDKRRSKYRRKKTHKKKVRSIKELSKVAWRIETGMIRDKAKRQGLHRCFSDGVPPWLKRTCNKRHRQWERACLRAEDYDKLGSKLKRKDIFDPWMWF